MTKKNTTSTKTSLSGWPEEVILPERIGTSLYCKYSKPCCSIGHFLFAVGVGTSVTDLDVTAAEKLVQPDVRCRWRRAFREAARKISTELLIGGTEGISDSLSPKQRLLAYAVAWGLCGYDIHNYPEATELIEQLSKTEKKPLTRKKT